MKKEPEFHNGQNARKPRAGLSEPLGLDGDPLTPRAREGLLLEESMEQVVLRDGERFQEPEKGGEPDFADAAFDPADLHAGEAGRVLRRFFLL